MTDGGMSNDDRAADLSVVWNAADAFEQLPVTAGAWHGPQHVFDAANAAYRVFINRPDVIGLTVAEIFPELLGQQLLELFDRVYRTEQPESAREWRFQMSIGQNHEMQEFYLDMSVAPRRGPDGSVIGVVAFGTDVTTRVRERQEAQRLAAEAQQRYEAVRDVVAELQGALLPTTLPILPHAIVAARYLVASRDQTAGGDWFDVVPLPDGRLALIVGDIVGHGVAASAAMGQLRTVLRSVLLETSDPGQALAWADRSAARTETMRAATVCVVTVDPATGALTYSTCGHPPPLLITEDGTTRYLPPTGGAPLGTGTPPVFATDALGPGEVVMLYTDGLIERPGVSLREGMDVLAQVAADAVTNRVMPIGASTSAAERACQQGVELVTRMGFDDDVTALAMQRRPTPLTGYSRQLPAEPQAVAQLTSDVLGWLVPAQISYDDQVAVQLAVSELVANTVEHAYPAGQHGPVRLDADLGPDGVLHLSVSDNGHWQPPTGPEPTSGRGLWLTGATLNAIHIDRGDTPTHRNGQAPQEPRSSGTVVTVKHLLTRPATLASGPINAPVTRPPKPYSTRTETTSPRTTGAGDHVDRVLRVTGPLTIATADQFADTLDIASRGGVHPLPVDLTDVDVLTSAAVKILFHARDQHATHGHPLILIATTDSLVAQVLDLVGLQHRHPVREQPDS